MMTAMKKNFLKKTKTNYTIMQSLKGTEIWRGIKTGMKL
jgi:hypothetical protein